MSSFGYGTEYKIQGKWVAKDKELSELSGERMYIEIDDASAPNISFETAGEEYYPQTLYSWHDDQLHWKIKDEIFTLHVLSGPGKLEHPYQKYVTIENTNTVLKKHYKLVEITEEEYEDTREWYKSVKDKIWCDDSQWRSLTTKDRIDNDDVTTLSADKNGFIIKDTSLYGYDESIGGPIVNIPQGIKRIKAQAFSKCQGVTHVHIPDSVSSIGDNCFSKCQNLMSVRLPEGLTKIFDYVFQGCENLVEIKLPDSITSIGRDSFADCKSLAEMVMPKSLTVIGERSFHGTTNLEKISFNSGLEKIEFAAFGSCTSLTELYIPASVKEIGSCAFNGCSILDRIIVEDGNETYCSKNNCLIERKNKEIILACNNSVIPDDGSVERIGYKAFSNCKKIESIIVPESIESIGSYAFEGCSALRNIQLPRSLSNDDGAFRCNFRYNLYGEGLFMNCSSLKQFEIPSWMTEISKCMFSGCESLKEIKIPDCVTKIGVWAFGGCKSLTELVIPKSVTRIGSEWSITSDNGNFIDGCSSLIRLEVEDGNLVYHSRDNCIIETNTGTLFAMLENGVIPNDGSVTKIGAEVVCACENMTEISLPECITTIDSDAFSKLRNLNKINIPKSVNDIGSNAFFEGCGAVKEENGIYYIGNWALGIVKKEAERAVSDTSNADNVLPESGDVTIREGTVGICAYAFSFCDNLKSISIPESVKMIGNHAFNACNSLERIALSEGLINIGDGAFNYCQKLKLVAIPHTVKSIGEAAFRFCKGIQSIVIPDTEIEIGRDAFAYCGDILNIDIPERIVNQLTHFSSTDEMDEDDYGRAAEVYEDDDELTLDFVTDDRSLPF